MPVDNFKCHGCFSLQYFAHLACLSVLTRQVKCPPTAAYLTSATLFFMPLHPRCGLLSEPALAIHPSIIHSNAPHLWLVVGWCDTPVTLEEPVKGRLTWQSVGEPGEKIIVQYAKKKKKNSGQTSLTKTAFLWLFSVFSNLRAAQNNWGSIKWCSFFCWPWW